jgi:hypothetical protein
VVNNRVFFRFDESYASLDVVECNIYDSKMQLVKCKTQNTANPKSTIVLKRQGYNQYEVDLATLNISSGFYYLKVKNGKGQSFSLKFLIN